MEKCLLNGVIQYGWRPAPLGQTYLEYPGHNSFSFCGQTLGFFEFAVFILLISTFLVFGASTSFTWITNGNYWPVKEWRSCRPEKQGIDSAKMSEITDYVRTESPNTTSVLVIRNGYIVFEEYYQGDIDTLRSLNWATMGVTSTLTGIALDEGLIESVDDKITMYLKNSYSDEGF